MRDTLYNLQLGIDACVSQMHGVRYPLVSNLIYSGHGDIGWRVVQGSRCEKN